MAEIFILVGKFKVDDFMAVVEVIQVCILVLLFFVMEMEGTVPSTVVLNSTPI
jgi:hypothetical protein